MRQVTLLLNSYGNLLTFQSSIRGFSFCGIVRENPRGRKGSIAFQSSIRGFSFCGSCPLGVPSMVIYFNPLYEALVFAAGRCEMSEKVEQNFNPLYEALVFAARLTARDPRESTGISILYTRL